MPTRMPSQQAQRVDTSPGRVGAWRQPNAEGGYVNTEGRKRGPETEGTNRQGYRLVCVSGPTAIGGNKHQKGRNKTQSLHSGT